MPQLIYIIEDQKNIRELLLFTMESHGYNAMAFELDEDALSEIRTRMPDLIICDIMLPGMSGIEAVKLLRANPATRLLPILLLTAKDSEEDKITGLDCGADDYVTKPFSVMELSARIRALLRRREAEPVPVPERFEEQELCLDHAKREVTVKQSLVELTYKEFELLYYLLQNKDRVAARADILNHIWGYEFEGESRTLDIHISSLRQKLGSAGRYIVTVRNVGYMFSVNRS